MKLNKKAIFSLFFLIILLFPFISAQEDGEIINVNKKNAEECIVNSNKIIEEMENQNFSTQRVEDNLEYIKIIYSSQVILESNGRAFDYTLVNPYCEEIKLIKENAYLANDDLKALEKFYEDILVKNNYNTTSVDEIMDEIKLEIINERYEKVPQLTREAYEEISNIESSSTTLAIFYEATTRGIKNFVKKNWMFLLAGLLIFSITFILFQKTISRYILLKKLSNLKLRREHLKKIVSKTQREYFQEGKISEQTFRIKTKKLTELVRDIDREIPLIQEGLAKLKDKNMTKALNNKNPTKKARLFNK